MPSNYKSHNSLQVRDVILMGLGSGKPIKDGGSCGTFLLIETCYMIVLGLLDMFPKCLRNTRNTLLYMCKGKS